MAKKRSEETGEWVELRRRADGAVVHVTPEQAEYLLTGGPYAKPDFESEWEATGGRWPRAEGE